MLKEKLDCKTKNQNLKKIIVIISILFALMLFSTIIVSAKENYGNVTYPQGMSQEMIKADYWKNLAEDSDTVLMTKEQIKEYNNKILEADNTNIIDLESIQKPRAGYFSKLSYSPLYINGKEINQDEYINTFIEAQKKFNI